ncbi:MAG: hypothetical protein COA86_05570 [Kangiella sp.]|nr:MAG: hypothetical protein COA86_05570 [Kangiella sp.]
MKEFQLKLWVALILLSMSLFLSIGMAKNANPHLEIKTGADRSEQYLPRLKGKRVGVLVNPTSRTQGQHLVDFLVGKGINVALIFAPEHGFRGEHGAGEMVKDNRDSTTGIEIISLHGKTKRPLQKYLEQLDILLFDIQDVGVRYYTYISSMHYFMQTCATNNIPLIVLDRPNPNGDYIAGPILDLAFQSFVGMHQIPVVHGLTVAELAMMIQGEGWLETENTCELHIVANKNYHHGMQYSLPVKPSPNLPNDRSIRLYPSLGFFEATPVSVGRGSELPFQVLGYPNRNMGDFQFTPGKIRGSWKELNHADELLYGEDLSIKHENDDKVQNLSKMNLSLLVNWHQKFKANGLELITRPKFLAKLSGSNKLSKWLKMGLDAKQIEKRWHKGLLKYKTLREKYLIYPDSDYMKGFK